MRTPKIYRTMIDDGGKPLVGQKRCMLGVRVPGTPSRADVDLDADGSVKLNGKGLSVFGSVESMYPELVPLHLSTRIRGAAGPSNAHIWSHGTERFESGGVSNDLHLDVPIGDPHGTVCPTRRMPIATFQQALKNTGPAWRIDEL